MLGEAEERKKEEEQMKEEQMKEDPRENVDWFIFDGYPVSTCHCRCGEVFRSHAKFVLKAGLVTRKSCPKCGNSFNCHRIVSDVVDGSISINGL